MKNRFRNLTLFPTGLRLTLCCMALMAATGTSVRAQETAAKTPTAEEVIDRYIEARGGRDKLASIKSQKMVGTLSIPAAGVKGNVEMLMKDNGKFLMKIDVPGVMTQETGSDGNTVWSSSNVTGTEILTDVRAEQMRLEMRPALALEMKDYFDSLECTGTETFAGEKCYVVVAKKEGMPPLTAFYSVETGLEKGNRMKGVTAMGEMEITSEVTEHGEVDGITYPKTIDAKLPNGMVQSISTEKMIFNPDLDDSAFELPEKVQSKLKK